MRALRDLQKLRLPEDEPDSPVYVRDRTPLKKGQMTTRALRDEFRRDPALPILVGDDIFIRGIRRGVEQGDYVYQRDELLFGPGDPPASVQIDEQAVVLTMGYAKNTGVWPWPRPVPNETGNYDSPETEGSPRGPRGVREDPGPLDPSLTPHRYEIRISVDRSIPYESSREDPCH